MKKLFLPLAALLILFILTSCIGDREIRIVSFRDPDFTTARYDKVCVVAYIGDIQSRQNFENQAAYYMNMNGMDVKSGISLLPPTRDWNDQEIRDILLKNGFDACLVIELTDKNTVVVNEPASKQVVTETKKSSDDKKKHDGDKDEKKDKSEIVTTRTTITETPAHQDINQFAAVKASIIDLKSNYTAWIGHAKYEDGSQFNIESFRNNDFRKRFFDYLVLTVLRDRIISSRPTDNVNR